MDIFTPFIVRPKAEPEAKQEIAIKKISAMPRNRKLSDKRKELTARLRARGYEDHIVTEGELIGIDADAEDLTYDAHGHTPLSVDEDELGIQHVDVNEASLYIAEETAHEQIQAAESNAEPAQEDATENSNAHWDDWA